MVYRYGFGFRGASPPWPYVGRGRGGLPRCRYFGAGMKSNTSPGIRGTASYPINMTLDRELSSLHEQAGALRSQLDEIEIKIKDLEASKQ